MFGGIDLQLECGESEEEGLGFWVTKWSRSTSSSPLVKPLFERSRSSQFEPDLPAGTEQSIAEVDRSDRTVKRNWISFNRRE